MLFSAAYGPQMHGELGERTLQVFREVLPGKSEALGNRKVIHGHFTPH